MSNWTRAHDAWLAREVEGMTVWVNTRDGSISEFQDSSIPTYLTDPAAAIRAAEAWQLAGPDRRILMSIDRDGKRVQAYNGTQWHSAGDKTATAATAQALYRATGGPA